MKPATPAETPLLRRLKLSHLRLLAALAETGQISLAAEVMGIAQPAASRLLAEIEQAVDSPVHLRTGRGVTLTPVGAALARRAQRVQMELSDAAREIAEIAQGGAGHVRVGAVTGPALDRVLPALRGLRQTHPKVTVEVIVAASDILCQHLLSGRIDLALGRLPDTADRDLLQMRPIGTEPVALVVRRGHPLDHHGPIRPADLMAFDWVMPGPGSLLQRSVVAGLRAHGLEPPPQPLATASFLLTFALLQQSDAIAPLARAVAASFAAGPSRLYSELRLALDIEVEAFGLVTRANAALPPVAWGLAQQLLGIDPARGG